MRPLTSFAFAASSLAIVVAVACSATNETDESDAAGAGAAGTSGNGGAGGGAGCGTCLGKTFTPCTEDGKPGDPIDCAVQCAPGLGCADCIPGLGVCVGNEVHECTDDGKVSEDVVETCDVAGGIVCSNGACKDGCDVAADQPSNVGCQFWAVDLDQQDGFNDPASAPWGVALSNAGQAQANVTIEINDAAPGEPLALSVVEQVSVAANSLIALALPTRELDCGIVPNDYASPGTCLSSKAFRITSSAPIVVYQFNVFENAYSNDASLLLPTNALGNLYRVLGWVAGHPIKVFGDIIDRSYVTIVGTAEDTQVTVKPSWRIKGNPPIAPTMAGGEIVATLGPFDVLNLETDDATFSDDFKVAADLSGTLVKSTKPVAVFSGVETTSAPGGVVDVPTPGGWTDRDTCCLDHLEDQLFPMESVGKNYVVTRSPVRSTTSFREPDVLRFVGVAEPATVTTTLPSPFTSFTIQPGEVKTTWTQDDVIVTADKPVMVGQILVSNQYCDGAYTGDPSLTIYPPVEQFRTEYIILTPGSWDTNWVVIAAETGTNVTLDGMPTTGCITEDSGALNGVDYQSRRCPLAEGVHGLSGDKPFGIIAYGYGAAGSYAFAGGADVKKIYEPPPID